jgi:hypothetical protein
MATVQFELSQFRQATETGNADDRDAACRNYRVFR